MYDIVKFTLGFMAIILVALAGVVVSNVLRLGDMSALVITVDNVIRVR